MSDSYYPDLNDPEFNEKFLSKYEFKDKEQSPVYQHPRQLFLRNLMNPNTTYDSILMYWAVGSGKCHGKNTPIMMYDGSIKMVQDIKKDELLMGDDSTPRKVLSLARGRDKMYDIIPVKGESYRVNSEHILCLKASGFPIFNHSQKDTRFRIRYIENNKFLSKSFSYTDSISKLIQEKKALEFYKPIQNKNEQIIEISVKDYLKLSQTKKNILKGYKVPVIFPEKELPFDPYMIGYWLGDGTTRDSAITCQDSTVLYYFSQNLHKYNLNLNYRERYSYGISGFTGKIRSNVFLNTLNDYNIRNNKHIPMIYKCNSRENRLKLLAGLIDSDGSYDNSIFEFSQSLDHEQLINDVIYLCRSLGFACYKAKKKTSWTYLGVKKHGWGWRINISGEGIEEIPTLIPRKKAKSRLQIKDVLVTGITVKEKPRDKYYGFTVDKNNRYILGDFTVSHNSCGAISIAEGFKEYMNNMDRRILVMVQNDDIINNFRRQLETECGAYEYKTYDNINELEESNDPERKKAINRKIKKKINDTYVFTTYRKFTNNVLGTTVINKGKTTTKTRTKTKNSLKNLNNTVIIIDEAHHITRTDTYKALKFVLENSYNYRLILLTATPIQDNPQQILEICNLLNINDKSLPLLPIRENAFKEDILKKVYIKNSLIKDGIIKLTKFGEEELLKRMKGKVSYLESTIENYPTKIEIGDSLTEIPGSLKVINCMMSDYQYKIYKKTFKMDTSQNDDENSETDDNFNSRSSLYKNSTNASTFVYPGGLIGKDGFNKCFKKVGKEFELKEDYKHILTTDLKKYSTLNNINKSKGKIFIYSELVNYGGTTLIQQLLLENGYSQYGKGKKGKNSGSFMIYDGNHKDIRDSQLKVFNSENNIYGENIKIIIGSEVIAEGLTLKNIRQIHILDPDWNMGIINQIIGRGVRLNSHKELPENERNIKIYKYNSIYHDSNSKINFIDREKYILSERKDRANKKAERLLKIAAIDCNINKKTQIREGKEDFQAECDYVSCEYDCLIKSPVLEFDKFTYKYFIEFFDKYDIQFITDIIRQLFEKYFIWSLDDIINVIKDEYSEISDESIFTSLTNIVNNKTTLYDKYNREGFIIQRKNYFIFNPINIDINSSIYSKMLDFKTHVNEYLSLNDYIKKTQDITLKKKEKKPKANMLLKRTESDNLSEEDTEFNTTIRDTEPLYGSYRYKKDKKSNDFGIIDNKFRIIDNRKKANKDDNRKQNTGMVSTSLDKTKLLDIVNYFKISEKKAKKYLGTTSDIIISNLKKDQLITIIEKHLKQQELIFR
jgi:superfamily II DNA or RNA helicase